ncbi:iron-siderophore ABC transporter substrate-binding protein [Amycolatopsis acidiphila]|uniref:Iron-siderophore ABC transporter substrate-binding protein n=1 Tax=Amycolatopsis acidiphila TaxID=715473 RepID=A0A557ZZC3_9PSEU|nr:iron-siderophore ABC transporter substrate-binding protein [Amycolatopsis acidiphila]TVT17347.1 iron-siderophore ABC transporter substrate-binding protein [Amycolatopsis acidiphila]UIJ60640.1 iron-siderophore ABC transporter substrate-binding protein [Amycolatopsis acidiphila]GHG98332.1 ABC transporter substrate-binding protein [Amycolatopsis acidiphila]
MTSFLPRRRAVLAGALVSALLAVAGCGGDDTAQQPQGAAGGAYPVTIAHKYGSTTVDSAPKRVVTVGLTDQDALLALGVVPVGTTEWLGNFPGAIGPWAQDKLGTAAKPEVLSNTDGPQYEKIAALRPDLILGLYSALTQEQYDTLSKIAPTIAQPKEYADYGIPWQDSVRTVGKVLGRSADADKLVSDVEGQFTKARTDNPQFVGATALVATVYQGYFVYGSEDPRSRVLAALGFALPPDLDQVIGNKFGANISAERADLLDVKALVWLAGPDTRATLDADKLYSGLDVAKQKREVLVPDDSEFGSAMSFVSVLSLPYLLDQLVPQLAKAVDGNPAT